MSKVVQFQSLSSAVEAAFWHELGQKKIDLFKLDDKAQPIHAYYTTGTVEEIQPRICLDFGAFSNSKPPPYNFPAPGLVKNTNTVEDFKNLDVNKEFADIADLIWEDIKSGEAIKNPSLLTRFLVITFADLKKYRYRYWFAFPAITPATPFKEISCKKIDDVLSPAQVTSFRVNYESFRGLPEQHDLKEHGFFFLDIEGDNIKIQKLSEKKDIQTDNVMVGFADSGALSNNPGWHLRNFLVLLKVKWNLNKVTVFCYREHPGKSDISKSIVIEIDMTESTFPENERPKSLGWEKNVKGKLGPREVDLAPLMDPHRLASSSVDLNLKLMRWRLLPSLNLEKISSTKCLLFGAGTLGCNVARCLLGWGVRNITFIDNGKISFSNPVRQSLFNFEDCLDGGKSKSIAAAESLKKIFPGVNSVGYELNVPMPGHVVTNVEQTKKDVELIESLITSHDAIFLLMDTRESRWLPTMLAAHHRKLILNSALGFDTYLVMRHGIRPEEPETAEKTPLNKIPQRLGCYYCNDVVAPTDSLKDRTLDQQCTVTRPGLSFLASALVVELMVSILHHPKEGLAPASLALPSSERTEQELGLIPHQIRGFLTHFSNLLIVGAQYDKCTACSDRILAEYDQRKFEFLLQVFNDPKYLENITGLTQLHADTETADWENTESDEDDF